jgi:hypothetical protein
MIHLNQDSRCSGRDSNRPPHEYKSRAQPPHQSSRCSYVDLSVVEWVMLLPMVRLWRTLKPYYSQSLHTVAATRHGTIWSVPLSSKKVQFYLNILRVVTEWCKLFSAHYSTSDDANMLSCGVSSNTTLHFIFIKTIISVWSGNVWIPGSTCRIVWNVIPIWPYGW